MPEKKEKSIQLEQRIQSLEERLERIEKILGLQKQQHYELESSQKTQIPDQDELVEKRGMSIIGFYVIGIALVITLFQTWGGKVDLILSSSILVGMGALFSFKNRIFKNHAILELHFRSISYITAFLAFLKLNYFTEYPVFRHNLIFFMGMALLVLYFLWLEKCTWDWYSRFSLFLIAGATGLFTSNHFIIALFAISIILLGFYWSKDQKNQLLFPFALFLAYSMEIFHYFHILNLNLLPFHLPNGLQILFPFIYFLLSGILNVMRWQDENPYFQSITILNVFVGFGLVLLESVQLFHPALYKVHIFYFILALGLASYSYAKINSKYSTFFYAMSAYMALTISILTYFPFPQSLLWLCLQSLLVIATALWYRSKLIILANFFIFLGLFGTSIMNSGSNGWIHATYGITALLSARIINWKKSRLQLQTELMRNLYLLSAFLILPIALMYLVPGAYYAYSLGILAFGYFVLRIILKIKKYFYLSAGTILWGILFLLIEGFGSIPAIHLIFSFLLLGGMFLIITLYKPKTTGGTKTR
jgi:hypothetical protein